MKSDSQREYLACLYHMAFEKYYVETDDEKRHEMLEKLEAMQANYFAKYGCRLA